MLCLGQWQTRSRMPRRRARGVAGAVVDGWLIHHAVVDVRKPVVEPAQQLGIAALPVIPRTHDQLLRHVEAVEGVNQITREGQVPPARDEIRRHAARVDQVGGVEPAAGDLAEAQVGTRLAPQQTVKGGHAGHVARVHLRERLDPSVHIGRPLRLGLCAETLAVGAVDGRRRLVLGDSLVQPLPDAGETRDGEAAVDITMRQARVLRRDALEPGWPLRGGEELQHALVRNAHHAHAS